MYSYAPFQTFFISRVEVAECGEHRVLTIKRYFYSITNQLLAGSFQANVLEDKLVLETHRESF